jgi:hypothetical protein
MSIGSEHKCDRRSEQRDNRPWNGRRDRRHDPGELGGLALGDLHLPLRHPGVHRRLRHPNQPVALVLVQLHPHVDGGAGLHLLRAVRQQDRLRDPVHQLRLFEVADRLAQPGDVTGSAPHLFEQRLVRIDLPRRTPTTEVPKAGPVLAAIIEAKRQTGHLVDAERLAGTVDALVHRAHALGARAVYGASDIGQSLAGAMAYASPRLRLWHPGEPAAVLLVDGVVAGLSGVRLAAERAKTIGAERVDALILGALPDLAVGGHDPTIAQLVTLGREQRAAA